MATAPSRAIWKGAISFGLVHIPVSMHTATQDLRPKMRMIDAATGGAVGYRKYDKSTGEDLQAGEVAKGVEVDSGRYVTLSKDEIREALPRSTQLIEIEAFVPVHEVPSVFYNKPYYVAPQGRAQKVYALLREVLRRTGKAGLGRVVVSSRQHLALVVPCGRGLVVNLLRWSDEVRDIDALDLPGDAAEVGLAERELQMGEQLVLGLTEAWQPDRFHDEFREKVEALIEAKRQAGDITQGAQAAEEMPQASGGAEVIDLTELLRKSLQGAGGAAPKPAPAPAPAPRAAKKAATPKPAPAARRRGAANDEQRAAAAAAKGADKARAAAKPAAARKRAS